MTIQEANRIIAEHMGYKIRFRADNQGDCLGCGALDVVINSDTGDYVERNND